MAERGEERRTVSLAMASKLKVFQMFGLLLSLLGTACSGASQPSDAGVDTNAADLPAIFDSSSDVLIDSVIDDSSSDVSVDGDASTPGKWVTIPPQGGSLPMVFSMGSPTTECRLDNEDQHQVIISRAFEIHRTEVTQAQFQAVMGYNPSNSSCGNDCPVEEVSWHEAVAYCTTLSEQKKYARCYDCTGSGTNLTCREAPAYSGKNIYDCPGYRLPTEAEWEYAYRAGTTTALYNGTITNCTGNDPNVDKIGWYDKNSENTSHPVRQKQPNNWGLYDMAGNVWEWCHDWYQDHLGSAEVTDPWGTSSGYTRVLRGGSWIFSAHTTRAAARISYSPDNRYNYLGFRCCRTSSPN